jgi:hypothetical protein
MIEQLKNIEEGILVGWEMVNDVRLAMFNALY